MRAVSMRHVPTAMLSRQMAGTRGSSLVINLPGSPRSIREILDYVFAAVPYCVDLIGGPYITTDPEVVDSSSGPPMQDANDSSESLVSDTHGKDEDGCWKHRKGKRRD